MAREESARLIKSIPLTTWDDLCKLYKCRVNMAIWHYRLTYKASFLFKVCLTIWQKNRNILFKLLLVEFVLNILIINTCIIRACYVTDINMLMNFLSFVGSGHQVMHRFHFEHNFNSQTHQQSWPASLLSMQLISELTLWWRRPNFPAFFAK